MLAHALRHTHTQPTHTHTFTGVDHLHSTGNHTLTIDEIPSHRHYVCPSAGYHSGGARTAIGGVDLPTDTLYTGYTGGGKAHNHGKTGAADRSLAGTTGAGGGDTTGAGGNDNTGNSATVNTWRPLANVGIICSRNA